MAVAAPAMTSAEALTPILGGAADAQYGRVPDDTEFTMSGKGWLDAPDVRTIAAALIKEHWPYSAQANARVAYYWKRKGGKKAGQPNFGDTLRCNSLLKDKLGADFIVYLSADHVRERRLTGLQVEASVAHCLAHIGRSAKGELTLLPHEFSGFVIELQEYGPWQQSLSPLAELSEQIPLWPTYEYLEPETPEKPKRGRRRRG